MRSIVSTVIALCLVSALGIAAQPAQSISTERRPCTVANVQRAAECATIPVPETRGRQSSRTIDLNVVVLKAPAPSAADPVLFFAGGPGQGAATLAPGLARELDAVAPDRDIILVDQRGTGRSHPLTCEGGFRVVEPDRREELRQCRDALRRVADLDHYGTDASADDAADVVRALGYQRVHVVGVSYGTRLALRLMARRPDLVRTAVLRAIAPHGFNILGDGRKHAEDALARVFDDCRADAACHGAFPEAATDLRSLRARLRSTPDPISTSLLDRTLYALMLSTPTRLIIPWVTHTSLKGDTSTLARTAASIDAIYQTVAIGQYLSTVCSEDAPYLRADDKRSSGNEFDAGTRLITAACETWAVSRAPQPRRTRLPQPTLIVSGEIDPAMPAVVGENALRDFARGTHIVLPATAHGPMFPGCATDAAKSFIASDGAAKLEMRCLDALKLPPWKTS